MMLAGMAESRICDFTAQELANMVWAFVTGGQSQTQLFMVLAATAERRIGDFTAQELANMVWAFVLVD